MRILTVSLLGIVGLLLLGSAARAQITFINFLPLETNAGPGALLTQGVMPDFFLSSDFDLIRTTLTGDADFLPRNNLHANTGYSLSAAYEITIGPLPVHLFEIAFAADARLETSDGTLDGPLTDLVVSANVADINDLGTAITGTGISTQILGDGVENIDGALLAPPVVLAAGETYRVSLDVVLNVDIQMLTQDDNPLITHQFGGLSDFDGYQVQIRAAEVPEPSTWTILCVGAAGIGGYRALRRRASA